MGGFDYSEKNKRWQAVRHRVLRRDRYRCQEAERYGLRVPAEIVHHIWPVEDYPEYAYCDWNLISLSSENHNRMHDRTTGQLTELGKTWKRRTIPPSPPGGGGSLPDREGQLRAHAGQKIPGDEN